MGGEFTMRKGNGVTVHDEKERWGECTIKTSNGVRVNHEKKSDGVRVYD